MKKDKWYVQCGSIREVLICEDSAEAFELGLRKGIDRANYYEVEYELEDLITVSNQGFDDLEPLFHTTSYVLRNIGEEGIADLL